MARRNTLFVSPANPGRYMRLNMWKGAVEQLTADWNAVEKERGTTVSSHTWTVDSGGTAIVGLQNASLSAGLAEVEVTANESGEDGVKCAVNFADGTKAVAWWEIKVRDR